MTANCLERLIWARYSLSVSPGLALLILIKTPWDTNKNLTIFQMRKWRDWEVDGDITSKNQSWGSTPSSPAPGTEEDGGGGSQESWWRWGNHFREKIKDMKRPECRACSLTARMKWLSVAGAENMERGLQVRLGGKQADSCRTLWTPKACPLSWAQVGNHWGRQAIR